MQEILHAFGIDWRLIVIQIFNFSVLMGVLWYFLYTPVLRIISEREEKIKKGVRDAEAAEKVHAEANTEKQQIIKSAHAEAALVMKRSTEHGEEKAKHILAEANLKATKQIEAADARAEEVKAKALKESESEIARLAILGAEQLLRKELSK